MEQSVDRMLYDGDEITRSQLGQMVEDEYFVEKYQSEHVVLICFLSD